MSMYSYTKLYEFIGEIAMMAPNSICDRDRDHDGLDFVIVIGAMMAPESIFS